MRKWILALAFVSAYPAGFAIGQIVSAFPFQLQNNTVADATQVMANFNNLLTGINANAAKNGANSDITSLLGLTTPLAPSVGGTSTWTGGTSTGSANAQVVAAVVPSTFALTTGNHVVFVAGFANTDATTVNVAASGAKAIFRRTQLGIKALVGGEIHAGDIVEVVYDGTQFQLLGYQAHVGAMMDTAETAAPAGWQLMDGSCIAQAGRGAALFTVTSISWTSCTAGNFGIPDFRGRAAFGVDGGVGRLTATYLGTAAVLAAAGGSQLHGLTQAEFPSVNFNLSISDTRTWAVTALGPGGVGGPTAGAVTGAAPASLAVAPTGAIGGTAASGGSGTAFSVVPPALVVNKLIKY